MSHRLEFRKSSYSGRDQDCVEVAQIPTTFRKSSRSAIEIGSLPHGAAIRDSKHPDAGHLPFPSGEWSTFLTTALK
ncbi:DUF397 domain-containing protein [Nocardiopsis nanhaiensis]